MSARARDFRDDVSVPVICPTSQIWSDCGEQDLREMREAPVHRVRRYRKSCIQRLSQSSMLSPDVAERSGKPYISGAPGYLGTGSPLPTASGPTDSFCVSLAMS